MEKNVPCETFLSDFLCNGNVKRHLLYKRNQKQKNYVQFRGQVASYAFLNIRR